MSEIQLRTKTIFSTYNKNFLTVIAIFIVSFLPRLYLMNDGLFSVDEVLIAKATESSVKNHLLIGGANGRYGTVILNALLYLPYHYLTGNISEKVIIFSGVLSGSFVLVIVYLLILDLTENRVTSILTSLFLGFNHLFLITSTTGKEHIHALLFILCSLLAIAHGTKTKSFPLRIAGGIFYSISLFMHEAAIPFFPVILLFLIYSNTYYLSSDKQKLTAEILLFISFSTIPIILYIKDVIFETLYNPGTSGAYFKGLFSKHLSISLIKMLYIFEWPFLFLSLPGFYFAYKFKPLFTLTISWLLLFLYYGNISTGSERYLLFILTPLALLPSITIVNITNKINNAYMTRIFAAICIVVISGHGIYRAYPLLKFRSTYCGPKEMALYINKYTEPNSIIISMDEAPFFEYYANRTTLTHPIGGYNSNKLFIEQIKNIVRNGTGVYITDSSFSYDHDGYFRAMMDNTFLYNKIGHVMEEGWVRDIIIYVPVKNQVYRLELSDGDT